MNAALVDLPILVGGASAIVGVILARVFSPSQAEIRQLIEARALARWQALVEEERARNRAEYDWLEGLERARELAAPWPGADAAREDSAVPPMHLYHGTSRDALTSILQHGLEGRTRGVAFLSSDIREARRYGERHGDFVIVRIAANQAYQRGVAFTQRAGPDFTTPWIPPQFVDLDWILQERRARLTGRL